MKALNLETLLQAANYLDIKGLLDVTCKTVANMIKGKTPEEIRKTFNIKNDFTEEEEAQVLDLGLIIIWRLFVMLNCCVVLHNSMCDTTDLLAVSVN